MTAVVFETPGLIDVRAFTIMGAHAKPNAPNPIGYFGTGLKYAIAVLVRLGCEPVVWIGRDRFSFSTYATTFRGMPLQTIKMRVLKDGGKRPSYFEMPYTTAYGKGWEVWQAFRELESNTRDEGGKTYVIDGDRATDMRGLARGDRTLIVVDLPELVEAAEKIDEVFLPRGRRSGTLLEAFDDPGERLYYRTMRVKDLEKQSVFTYNVLEILTLTEDRTLASEWSAKNVVARWVLSEATADQVEKVLKAEEDQWEHGLDFPSYVKPSDAFREVMTERKRGLGKNAYSYYNGYAPRATIRAKKVWNLFEEYRKPWRLDGDAVVDADGEQVFARPHERDDEEFALIAEKIVSLLRAGEPPITIDVKPTVTVDGTDDPIPF